MYMCEEFFSTRVFIFWMRGICI